MRTWPKVTRPRICVAPREKARRPQSARRGDAACLGAHLVRQRVLDARLEFGIGGIAPVLEAHDAQVSAELAQQLVHVRRRLFVDGHERAASCDLDRRRHDGLRFYTVTERPTQRETHTEREGLAQRYRSGAALSRISASGDASCQPMWRISASATRSAESGAGTAAGRSEAGSGSSHPWP